MFFEIQIAINNSTWSFNLNTIRLKRLKKDLFGNTSDQ